MLNKIYRELQSLIFRHRIKRASGHERAELMRDKFYFLGENVELYTTDWGTEPYLISIHDNAVCAQDVKFITHDISCFRVANYLGISHSKVDKVGSIVLYDNCFVGAYSILMPNCSVGKNSVIGAGSLVTKHVPDNEVWAGVPAKFIMTIDDYAHKILDDSNNYPWMKDRLTMSKDEIIKLRKKHFFGIGM